MDLVRFLGDYVEINIFSYEFQRKSHLVPTISSERMRESKDEMGSVLSNEIYRRGCIEKNKGNM